MGNKLEQLLNTIVQRGWKPFGDERIVPYVKIDCRQIAFYKSCDDGMYQWLFDTDIRTVLSKESGLWQFVCENGMIKNEKLTHTRISQVEWGLDVNCVRKTTSSKYDFRLLESALRDEPELGQFLLDNIKV